MTASYLSHAVMWIWHVAQLCAVGLGVWALIDTVRRSDQHFIAADKRTKRFWLAVNAVGVAVVALRGAASMLGLLGVGAELFPVAAHTGIASHTRRPRCSACSAWSPMPSTSRTCARR